MHFLSSDPRKYHWVFEADIEACFDQLSHSALLRRVRQRIADKRVLALIKAFLRAGIMSEAGQIRDSVTGTPQGGLASPLLANVALSALDEHFCAKWDASGDPSARYRHRKRGGATYRIVRYADVYKRQVCGLRAHADALHDEVAGVLAPLGLRLSPSKTRVIHIDDGFDFLVFHIQRRTKKGTARKYVYTYPSKKALASVMGKVRALTARERHPSLTVLLVQLTRAVRGWCNYSRYVVGWMVASRESAALAETLIRQTCAKQNVRRDQLTLHADRGSSMTSKPVALLLADLGVNPGRDRPCGRPPGQIPASTASALGSYLGCGRRIGRSARAVSYTHLRAHET